MVWKRVRFGDVRILFLLFAHDVILLASFARDLQLSLHRFAAECEAARMKISTSKSEAMVLSQKKKQCTVNTMYSEDGVLLTPNKGTVDQCRDYFKDLLNPFR